MISDLDSKGMTANEDFELAVQKMDTSLPIRKEVPSLAICRWDDECPSCPEMCQSCEYFQALGQ